MSGVDALIRNVGPLVAVQAAYALGLGRSQNGVLDARFDQIDDGVHVDPGFSQPDTLGIAAETRLEVAQSPADLGLAVSLGAQRLDG